MDFFSLGDQLDYSDFNSIVYLLRKFKRLKEDLRLGSTVISSDFGSFNIGNGLESVGGNYIIESPVTITSNDVLKNCFYSFVFNVIDVNLSGTVNKRQVTVTGDTGDDGILSVILPTDLIESDEVILPEFTLDIVFDPHEYYTPMSSLNIELTADVNYVGDGDTATITATITDNTGTPIENLDVLFNINDDTDTDTTDENGQAETTYTGNGIAGKVIVRVGTESIAIYDGGMISTVFTGENIRLGRLTGWLISNGDVTIDWGDGTQDTVNNPTNELTHTYSDGLDTHTVWFGGDITQLGAGCFLTCDNLISIDFIYDGLKGMGASCFKESGLTSIVIPEGVTYVGSYCFNRCDNLTSISIPASVPKLGTRCFFETSILDYQLYWKGENIITYDKNNLPTFANTYFTIPKGETQNYVNKKYPLSHIIEREGLYTATTLTSDSSVITVGDSVTLSGSVTESNTGLEDVPVKIYQGTTLLDTVTTDSNGEFEKEVTGLNAGSYSFKAVYDGDSTYERSNSSIVNVTVNKISTSISLSAVESSIDVGDTPGVTGALTSGGIGLTGVNVKIYQDNTLVDTVITGIDGAFSYTGDETTGSGSIQFKAVYDGTSTYAECISNIVTITVAISYVLTTNDLTMTYKDGTQFIATVTKDGEPYGIGEYVAFNISDRTYNRQIDENGQAKLNINFEQGSWTITSTYGLITNTNTITINKASSTTTLTADKQSILTTESVTLTATTIGSTGAGIHGNIKIYEGSTLIDTISSGESTTLSGLGVGTHSFKAVCDGDYNHYGSESSVISVVVLDHTYALSLTGTAIIQSGDSDVITATLTRDGVAYSGQTLSYEIKHGSTIIDSGTTSATDSSGQTTITYTGTGIGDVDIIVSHQGMLLQETYAIEDCLLYTSSVSNTFGSTFGFYNIYDLDGLNSYEITCKLSANKTKGLSVALHQNNNDTNTNIIRGGYEGGNINSIACLNPSYSSTNEWINSETYTTGSDRPILIRKDNNGVYVKVNDVNSHTITSYPSNLRYFGMESWNNSKTVTVKEIKIKAL